MPQLAEVIRSFNIPEIDKILNSMANEDALKILIASNGGISNSARIIQELGLTQKRYYTHLKDSLTLV